MVSLQFGNKVTNYIDYTCKIWKNIGKAWVI